MFRKSNEKTGMLKLNFLRIILIYKLMHLFNIITGNTHFYKHMDFSVKASAKHKLCLWKTTKVFYVRKNLATLNTHPFYKHMAN